MNFPVTDVVKNVKYFLGVVKRATGNARDPQAESNKKEASQKPGKFMTYPHVNLDSRRYKLMPSRVFS